MIEDNSRFLKQLMRHEGCCKNEDGMHTAYRCPAGFLTIGYGHNLDVNPICGLGEDSCIKDEYAVEILRDDCHAVAVQLDGYIPWWRDLCEPRQAVLLNMAFNMGVAGLLGFKNMLRAVQSGDYGLARQEMLNSRWASQVGRRAPELAKQMQLGYGNGESANV